MVINGGGMEDINTDKNKELVEIDESLDEKDFVEIPLITDISEDGLKNYLNRISQFQPLSREEEYELGKRIQQGDKKALEKLVLSNLKFVVSIANRYKNTGLPLADIINQGNLGLLEAAKRFDPERGVKFISYAVWWIRQAIIQALAEQSGTVKLPLKQASILYKINEAIEVLSKELGREPTPDEIAVYLDMDPADIENVLRVSRNYLSLEAPIKDGEDRAFIDLLESGGKSVEEEIFLNTLKANIEEIVDELNEREAQIIKWRFGLEGETPKTLEEIGEILNISRERVRQIEARALNKLKKKALKRKLNDFLN
ncbi:DNA-directed RNA polymerase sigma 70 factor [Deferribacter desulfuricans SSM1]|uniref:DNA-directed RNA polymerase sigma 70 factor n=2 Tax=Deferribacter TaxID=53572 RepID=D3P9I5_DEFDS|nr:DNA-directed RNA polymerase sigma 70 factor [Deferribacter desulfuricans SSM1]